MISIFKKEFNQFFHSLSGYIIIILFLFVNGIYLFVLKDSNLFDIGYANLDPFFTLAPWVFLFLIPAITMRSISEEFKTGTFEILKTSPITKWQIILGKYLALLLIALIALLPCLIYIYTIDDLSVVSTLDTGGLAGSFTGLIFLAGVFSAIGIACSGLTNNSVIAFLITVFSCLVLYFGFSAISKLPGLEGNFDYYLEMIGIDYHYRSISRGVVDSRDVIYFICFIYFFLFLAVSNLKKVGRS